ncbi:MAG: DNA polymerase IV, partial [Deltaproteobacteria bacterium]|nr:DNA polymerase IV [Deltaproteobacteria bacterium]
YEARAFGISAAMPIKTAERLCPKAVFIQGNFTRYIEASKKFMTILVDFSPFLEPGGLDEAYLDATGFESLHRTIYDMAQKIKKRVRDELGLPVSIGIAGCKVVAKVASSASKPDGLLEVPPGEDKAFLAPLPIGKLPGVGKKTEVIMSSLGVRTIGNLAAMPEDALKSRFGVYGSYLWHMANANDDRPVEPPGEAKSVSRETTFAEDNSDMEFLTSTLWRLTEEVGADLRSYDKMARTINLKLRYKDFTTITRSTTLKQSTDRDNDIYAAGEALLERALMANRMPVRLIGIGASGFVPKSVQLDLLDNRPQRLSDLYRVIDRIRAKYGFEAIRTGRAETH